MRTFIIRLLRSVKLIPLSIDSNDKQRFTYLLGSDPLKVPHAIGNPAFVRLETVSSSCRATLKVFSIVLMTPVAMKDLFSILSIADRIIMASPKPTRVCRGKIQTYWWRSAV
jgi:hypothetical protein